MSEPILTGQNGEKPCLRRLAAFFIGPPVQNAADALRVHIRGFALGVPSNLQEGGRRF